MDRHDGKDNAVLREPKGQEPPRLAVRVAPGLVRGAPQLLGGRGEHYVSKRHGHEWPLLYRPACVENLDRGVRERNEVLLPGVEEVGQATAVALGGELQHPGYPVTRGLDDD